MAEPVEHPRPLDETCRAPLTALFAGAAAWLCVASALACVNAIQFVRPEFLAGSAAWTFGRLRAVTETAFLYGFALPMAFGIGLWLVARLGRVALPGPGFALIGAVFWNIGVAIGTGGVWAGGALPYEGFALPRMAIPILFSAFVFIAASAFLAFHQRRVGSYISQWLILASFAWFGWCLLNAGLWIYFVPVRGLLRPLAAEWFYHNLTAVVLGFAGLAVVFYYIPKRLERPLHSQPLALFGLGTLAICGGFGHFACAVSLPAWVGTVARGGTALLAIPMLAVGLNIAATARGKTRELDADPVLRYCIVGLVFWFVANFQSLAGALPSMEYLASFTLYWTACGDALLRGFFLLIAFGAASDILPRVLGKRRKPSIFAAAQFWCAVIGISLCYLARLTSGVAQGVLLNDPSLSFTLISRTVSPPLIAAALGEILILAAALAFAIDLARLLTSSVDSPPASEPIAAAPQPPNKSPWTPLFCLGISLTLSVSWLACLAGPILQLNALGQEPDAGVDPQLYAVPRSGLALQGAEVYRANGCAACHTQQVRPALDGPDLARGWGKRRTVARDFIFDDPAMPGTIRLGPDLANIGLRQNPAAFLARLRQPSSVVKGARMPPFAFLFETGADGASRPRPEAFALAAYLQSLHSGAFLYEAPEHTSGAPQKQ